MIGWDFLYAICLMGYCVFGFLYSLRVEKDDVLIAWYSPAGRERWLQYTFYIGLLWPVMLPFNFLVRRIL